MQTIYKSTQVGGLYGTNKNLIWCEKRCEITLKRCEIADIEEFSLGNLCKPYIFLKHSSRRIMWYKRKFN